MAKKSTAPPQAPSAPDPAVVEQRNRQKVVDRYAELTYKLKPFRPDLREHEALASTIRGWYTNEDPAQSFRAEGVNYTALLGTKANKRKVVNIRHLALRLKDKFFEIASVTLEAVESSVPAEECALYITESQTGSRSLDVMPRLNGES